MIDQLSVNNRRGLLFTALAFGISGLACDLDIWDPARKCTEEVTLEVLPGPPPVFRWVGDCDIVQLEVKEDATFNPVWTVNDSGGLTSPIEYGVLPEGSQEMVSPGTLISGERYVVRLWASGGEDTMVTVATGEFIAQ